MAVTVVFTRLPFSIRLELAHFLNHPEILPILLYNRMVPLVDTPLSGAVYL